MVAVWWFPAFKIKFSELIADKNGHPTATDRNVLRHFALTTLNTVEVVKANGSNKGFFVKIEFFTCV